MDKIEISIVGRDPDGIVNATETKVFYKGRRIDSGDPDWARLREALSLALRQCKGNSARGERCLYHLKL